MTRITTLGAIALVLLSQALPARADAVAASAPATSAASVGAQELPPGWTPASIVGNVPGCRPMYPPDAVKWMAQGTTRLSFDVDATGHVKLARIVESAGNTRAHRALDVAALQALSTCPFKPALDDHGQPQPGTVAVSYTWKIE